MLGNCASHELSLASGAPDGHRVPASPNVGWWPCQQGSYATSGFEHQVAVVSRDLACNPRPRVTIGAHGGNQEPPSRGSDTQSAFCPTLAPLQTPATPTAPATLSLALVPHPNSSSGDIAQPKVTVPTLIYIPIPHLFGWRATEATGEATLRERPHYWGEATPLTPG